MIFFREYCHLIHPVEKLDFKPERKSGSSLQTWLELNELNECILLFILVYRPVPVPYLWTEGGVIIVLSKCTFHICCDSSHLVHVMSAGFLFFHASRHFFGSNNFAKFLLIMKKFELWLTGKTDGGLCSAILHINGTVA
jgi:hypothetical protein